MDLAADKLAIAGFLQAVLNLEVRQTGDVSIPIGDMVLQLVWKWVVSVAAVEPHVPNQHPCLYNKRGHKPQWVEHAGHGAQEGALGDMMGFRHNRLAGEVGCS